ncbi:sensor histidine kinase [Alicyclobacillus tolerans]|uniref:sensor histidine kinase n=1 Tax=Alicyclobacillus tolerans TaxID=90970 RepID=UPI003B782A19
MKLRSKISGLLGILVLFMATVFYLISHVFIIPLFSEYVRAAEHGEAEQWARSLAYYYTSHGNSWGGVGQFAEGVLMQSDIAHPNNYVEKVAVYTPEGKPITSVVREGDHSEHMDSDDAELIDANGMVADIWVGNKPVGQVRVVDAGADSLQDVQMRVLRLMDMATLGGGLAAAVFALLLGFVFASRLTKPLQSLVQGIARIGRGESGVRVVIASHDEIGHVAEQLNYMAEKLEQLEAARKRLVADVAHELRTPLTVMEGQLELIQQGVIQPSDQTLLPILDEVMRLSRLVDDLHQLNLADGGVLKLNCTEADLVAILRRIMDNFLYEAAEEQVRLRLTTSANELVTYMDASRITQVFVNLLGNALRHCPPGGAVDVQVLETPQNIVCIVTDDGPGIPSVDLPHIFDRFYRGDESRSRESGGMGLGLAIAREFVQAHGGTLLAANHPSRGAQFTMTLPKQLRSKVEG